jgi:hypothetical protein
MSESDSEATTEGIGDEQLPDDLVGGEDNPLAEEPEEQPDFDVLEGKDAAEGTQDDESDKGKGPADETDDS